MLSRFVSRFCWILNVLGLMAASSETSPDLRKALFFNVGVKPPLPTWQVTSSTCRSRTLLGLSCFNSKLWCFSRQHYDMGNDPNSQALSETSRLIFWQLISQRHPNLYIAHSDEDHVGSRGSVESQSSAVAGRVGKACMTGAATRQVS